MGALDTRPVHEDPERARARAEARRILEQAEAYQVLAEAFAKRWNRAPEQLGAGQPVRADLEPREPDGKGMVMVQPNGQRVPLREVVRAREPDLHRP